MLLSDDANVALYKELYLSASEKQFSYGKWLLASLLAVHAGSLLAISQAGKWTEALYVSCGPLLIFGVGASLFSGGLAWVNFTTAMNVYARCLKASRRGEEHKPSIFTKAVIYMTLYGTPVVATLSLLLFLVAAFRATQVLRV